MNNERSELERLQAEILNRLDKDEASDALARLREIETRISYYSWIESFDPHMAQLAAELVRKWGRKKDHRSDAS